MITFSLEVGPINYDTNFHVLDLELPYNILLDRPWIHTMQVIPSMYHQFLNLHHEGQKLTILGDPQLFAHYRALSSYFPTFYECHSMDIIILVHSKSLASQVDPDTLSTNDNSASTLETPFTTLEMKVKSSGCGEYDLQQTLLVHNIPLSTKAHGRPCYKLQRLRRTTLLTILPLVGY